MKYNLRKLMKKAWSLYRTAAKKGTRVKSYFTYTQTQPAPMAM